MMQLCMLSYNGTLSGNTAVDFELSPDPQAPAQALHRAAASADDSPVRWAQGIKTRAGPARHHVFMSGVEIVRIHVQAGYTLFAFGIHTGYTRWNLGIHM